MKNSHGSVSGRSWVYCLLSVLSSAALLSSCGQAGNSTLVTEQEGKSWVEIDSGILMNSDAYEQIRRLTRARPGSSYPGKTAHFEDISDQAQDLANDNSLLFSDPKENRLKVSTVPPAIPRTKNFEDSQYADMALDFLRSQGLIVETPFDRIGQTSVHELAVVDSGGDGNSTRDLEEIFVVAYRFVNGQRAFFFNAIVHMDPETGTVRGFNIKNWVPLSERHAEARGAWNFMFVLTELVKKLRAERSVSEETRVFIEGCTQGWMPAEGMLVPALDCTGYENSPVSPVPRSRPDGVFVTIPVVQAFAFTDAGLPEDIGDSPSGRIPPLKVISMTAPGAANASELTANAFTATWNDLYEPARSVHLDSNERDRDTEDGPASPDYLTQDPSWPVDESFHLDAFNFGFLEAQGCAAWDGKDQSHCLEFGESPEPGEGPVYASTDRQPRLAPLGDGLDWALFMSGSFLTSYTYDFPCADCEQGEEPQYDWAKEWSAAFDGLHGALGFAAASSLGNGNGAELARDFVSYLRFYPVRWAWYEAVWDNWSSGEKSCCASTRNAECNLRCNYLDDAALDKEHCCPSESLPYWDDPTESWQEEPLSPGAKETLYRPGLAGVMAIPQNSNERLDAPQNDCHPGEPCYRIRNFHMTGHQACEIWKDD